MTTVELVTRYPIVFEPGDFVAVRCRNRQASMSDTRKVLRRKVMRIILQAYHGVTSGDFEEAFKRVRVIRVTPREDTPKHWGLLLEVLYCFVSEPGTYRHVFHFVPDSGGLSGQLFTQTRRFIAK